MKAKKKVWFVKHPLSRYNEDVKELAETKRLQIVNSKFEPKKPNPDIVEINPPKLTLKKEIEELERRALNNSSF